MTDKSVLEGTQAASFNGVPFLVRNSAIKFGQKNITHKYGESDRTEVEHNGKNGDLFNLELIVYGVGEDYYSQRNALKSELEKKAIKVGTLIHPFQGTVKCKVVGEPELTETFTDLGIAYFAVTFQQCSDKIYPVSSTDNTAQIASMMSDTLAMCEASVAAVKASSGFVNSFTKLKNKLTAVSDAFNAAKAKINIATSYVDKVNSTILKFRNDVNRLIALPGELASSITGLFNTVHFVATKPLDNINFQKQLFGFGSLDGVLSSLTVEYIEINKNNKIINNAIRANSLALCFGTLPGVTFDTQDDLDATRKALNDQFDLIYEDLDFDIQNSLSNLSALANAYLDTVDTDRVVDFDAELAPLSVICYNLYGNTENADKISKLNRLENNVMAQGTLKVIAE